LDDDGGKPLTGWVRLVSWGLSGGRGGWSSDEMSGESSGDRGIVLLGVIGKVRVLIRPLEFSPVMRAPRDGCRRMEVLLGPGPASPTLIPLKLGYIPGVSGDFARAVGVT